MDMSLGRYLNRILLKEANFLKGDSKVLDSKKIQNRSGSR